MLTTIYHSTNSIYVEDQQTTNPKGERKIFHNSLGIMQMSFDKSDVQGNRSICIDKDKSLP